MAHRATIYDVRVHKRNKPDDLLPLGDIDQQGTYLGDVLQTLFDATFAATSDSTEKAVRCSTRELDSEDLKLLFQHGEKGLVADIMDANDQLRIRQEATDTQLVRCGSLFRLPRNQTLGWWALHVNNNRSAKGLVHAEMVNRFKARFSDLMLVVRPCVMSSVLERALEDGRLESIKLVKYDKSSDFADANRWVEQDTHAKVELRVSPLERGKRLVAGLAQRAVRGDASAYGQIVSFEGLPFDEARLQVTLENGAQRTFNLQAPEGGHPFTADIEPTMQRGEPTDESVLAELGRVLGEMG